MNAKSFGMSGGALVLCLLGAVLATGCRPSETQEERPDAGTTGPDAGTVLAQVAVGQPRPNLMMLVDTSGSMRLPVDEYLRDSSGVYVCRRNGTSSGERCGSSDAFPCDTSKCPTRWTSLQEAMASFLGSSGTIARIGLATYPDLSSGNAYNCGGTTRITVALPTEGADDEATLASNAARVNAQLQAIKNSSTSPEEQTPQGGTPTNESLQYMGTRPELQTPGRSDFVLLLTGGLPNCNMDHPTPYPSPSCQCTLGDVSGTSLCSYEPYDRLGCLDKEGTVSAVTELKNKNIQTIVIGFGAELATWAGTGVLNAMAEQGGFARTCTQNADCGSNDTCDTARGLCGRRFYPAGNKDELVAALQRVVERLPKASCLLPLDNSGSYTQESLVVSLDGQVLLVPGESWSLTSNGLLFTGTACQRLEAATPSAPVAVEVRVRGAP